MKPRRRMQKWLVILTLLCTGIAFALRSVPQERDLLEDAFSVGNTTLWWRTSGKWDPPEYEWITEDVLFSFREQEPIREPHLISASTRRAAVLNGLDRKMTAVSRNRVYEAETRLWELSPDKKWILWTVRGDNIVYAAKLDGRDYRKWNVAGEERQISRIRWQDNRNWFVEQKNFKTNKPVSILRGDVEIQKPNSLQPAINFEGYQDWNLSFPPRAYQTLLSSAALPANTQIMTKHTDNARQRVALLIDCKRRPHYPLWLERLLPQSWKRERSRIELWTCKPDGTEGKYAGYITEEWKPLSTIPGSSELVVPQSLRWLPDGKRISFLYKEILRIVPVDKG